MRIVDPTPQGYLYGFPKVVPNDIKDEDISDWVYRQGYPKELADSVGGLMLRMWDDRE